MRTKIVAIALGVALWTPIAASMPDTIIPLPKQMKLTGREVALTDGSIVLATDEKKLRIAPRPRDDHRVVDSVEVFLDPGRTRETFYHWIVDAGGNFFDAARRRGSGGAWKYSRDFDSKCKFAVKRLPDRWIAEIAIPQQASLVDLFKGKPVDVEYLPGS